MSDDGVSDSMILHFYQSTRGPEDNKWLSRQQISLREGSPITKYNLAAVGENVVAHAGDCPIHVNSVEKTSEFFFIFFFIIYTGC